MDTRTTTAHDLARRSLLLMQRWDDGEAAAIIHPDAANDEAVSEPPAARGRGPWRRSRRPTTGCTPPSTSWDGTWRSWWPRGTWWWPAP